MQYAIYIRKSDTPCFLRILRSILGNGVYTVKYTYSTGTRQKRMSQRYPLSVGGERDEVKVILGGGGGDTSYGVCACTPCYRGNIRMCTLARVTKMAHVGSGS